MFLYHIFGPSKWVLEEDEIKGKGVAQNKILSLKQHRLKTVSDCE